MTGSTGALPLVEDPAPTNAARVLAVDLAVSATQPAILISSASGTERGEVFYGPTDWLGSRDPMTRIRYTCGSSTELAD
jgi:hypothetical protein